MPTFVFFAQFILHQNLPRAGLLKTKGTFKTNKLCRLFSTATVSQRKVIEVGSNLKESSLDKKLNP